MRVIFSIPHVSIGGAQRVCLNLIRWLQNNTDTKVLLIIGSKVEVDGFKYNLDGIDYIYLPKGWIDKIFKIRKETKKFQPDIYVTFGVPNCPFDILGTLSLGLKNIVCERNDPAHFAGKTITKILSRLLMRFADGYVFQTYDARNFYGGKIAKQSVVIPNPLFFNKDQKEDNLVINRDKIIVTTGRLNKQKNHPLLIKAFKKVNELFPDYKLIIYGDGSERANDEALINSLGLSEKVILPGAITNVLEVIRNASLFVMSSDFEGMPNSLMEAMAVGLPCISTDCPCGGPKSIIINNKNGILVPVGDQEKLEKAMISIISNQTLANKLSLESLKIRDTHSIDAISNEWMEYFKIITS